MLTCQETFLKYTSRADAIVGKLGAENVPYVSKLPLLVFMCREFGHLDIEMERGNG